MLLGVMLLGLFASGPGFADAVYLQCRGDGLFKRPFSQPFGFDRTRKASSGGSIRYGRPLSSTRRIPKHKKAPERVRVTAGGPSLSCWERWNASTTARECVRNIPVLLPEALVVPSPRT
jgi:hypothetical protein